MKKFFLLFSLVPLSLCALPQGESIKAGKASLTRGENSLVIEVSDRAVLHYESFNIGKGERVEFIQPGKKATVLNRVTGKEPSSILGNLSSNGRIFLLNANGIYFGKEAVVNVGSLIASTLDLYDKDFERGKYPFFSTGSGEIINEGFLSAAPEGVIALIAAHVHNEGTIRADVGKILVGSAEKITLDLVGDGLMSFVLEKGELLNVDPITIANKLVEVEGTIQLVTRSTLEADDIVLLGSDIRIEGSVVAKNDLFFEANKAITLRDSTEDPLQLHAYRDLKLQAELIDIFALNHPETSIASGGLMTFVSNHPVSADAHFYSGGDFSLLTRSGKPGDFFSYWDPIISATGSVTFGAYTGASLLVESTGAIVISGDITITMADLLPCSLMNCTSNDCTILKSTPALILNPGLASLQENCTPIPPNTNVMGTLFQTSFVAPSNTVYLSGDISGAVQVLVRGSIVLQTSVMITPPASSAATIELENVDGSFNFAIIGGATGSTVTLGTLGGSTPIISFSTDFGETILNGDITAGGSITISSDQLTLNQDVTLSTASGLLINIPQTDSATSSSNSLTLNVPSGLANVEGAIGSMQPLGAFTMNNATELNLNGNITTDNGPITIVAPIDLGGTFTFTAGNGAVSIGDVVATAAGQGLEIDTTGGVILNGMIGMGVTSLSSFVVNNAGSVTGQAINADIVTISSSGAVTFTGNMSVSQNMGMNTISGVGVVQLTGMSSPAGSMASLVVTQTAGGSSPALNLGGVFSLDGDLTFIAASPTNILAATTLESLEGAFNISTPSINDANMVPTNSLTLSAPISNVTVTASGGIGLTNALASFTVTNGVGVILPAVQASSIGITATNLTLNGDLTSLTGGISITAATTLGATRVLNAGVSSLTITGDIISTTNGYDLTLDGSSISLDGDITLMNGFILANAPIVLQGLTTLTSGGQPITLDAVTGAEALTLNAGASAVTLNGDIGTMGTPLTSLAVTSAGVGPNPPVASIFAGTISFTSSDVVALGNMTANVGGITINETSNAAVNLRGTISANTPFLLMGGSEPIFLLSDTSITSTTSSITMQGIAIDASTPTTNAFLTLNAAGSISLPTGGIGQTNPLSGFTIVNASSITAPNVTTNAGGISLTSLMLSLNGNLTANNGPIALNSPALLLQSITLSSGVGAITLGGDITAMSSGFNFIATGTGIASLSADITLSNGEITFVSPLFLAGGNPALSTSGGAISLNQIDGAQNLTLNAGSSANVNLNGPIGNLTPLTGLTATASILKQLDVVTANGAISYTATIVNLGNHITSGGGNITLDADLILNGVVTLDSTPNGMISVTGTVDGDVAGRNLTLLSGSGMISLGNDLGDLQPLNNFTINGGAITFQGALYDANTQNYTGSSFDFTATSQLNLVSSTGGITFSTGEIQINSSLVVNTHGGDFSFPALFGTSGLNVSILTGSGTVTLGQIGMVGQFGTITAFSKDIFFGGPIVTNRVQLFASGSIANLGIPSQMLTMNSTAIFDTSSGTIGSTSSPIAVNTTGIVIAGTPSQLADFSGTAQGNTIFINPINVPCPLIFNGVVIHPCPTPPSPPPPPLPPPLLIPARNFYVSGIYSQYNSLASDGYFLAELVDEDYIKRRALLLFIAPRTFNPNESSSRKLIRKVKEDYEQRRMVSSP